MEIKHTHMINCILAETIGFVDKLFECLTSKNYLGNPATKEVPKEEIKPPAVKSEVEVRRKKFIGHIETFENEYQSLKMCHVTY